MEKNVTISDVAAYAKVSKATVSRILNRPEIVGPELTVRIKQAMHDLDFQPNRHARALSGVTTKTVGLLFFNDLWDLVLNPFWGMATSTVYNYLVLNNLDCNLIALGEAITSSERLSTRERYSDFLQTRNVDGFLVVGNVKPQQEQHLASSSAPVVLWGMPSLEPSGLTYVDTDHRQGARIAVDFLVAAGRTRVATITGDLSLAAARDRFEGYRQGLDAHEIQPLDALIAHGDFRRESGAAAMRQLLERGEPIDALFVANDEMALGALEVLNERKISVPDDIAIVGFDNVTLPRFGERRLTSVRPQYEVIGELLVSGLIALMRGDEVQSRLVPPTLASGDTA